jgi:hypothetical protein
MPHHLELCSLAYGTEPHSLKQIRKHNSSRFKNYRLSSTKSKSAYAYFSKPSSRSVQRAHTAEELEREPVTSIVASLRTGRANP